MQQALDNPFLVGNPVKPDKFIGRADLVNRLLHRVRTRQNSAIVGGPKIGKTSIFKCLATPENVVKMTDPSSPGERVVTILIDFQLFNLGTTPADFWKYVSNRMKNATTDPSVRETIQDFIKGEDFTAPAIETVFEDLAMAGYRFVIFLDEFDTIVNLKQLAVPDFLGALRSLTSVSESYQIIVSTRRPLVEINNLTQSINPAGSPYFNTLLEHQMGVFTEPEAMQLLSLGDPAGFQLADKQLIMRLAGLHPYRLQMGASILYDLKQQTGISSEEMRLLLIDRFCDMIDTNLSDVWENQLVEKAKITLAILALEENGQLANDHEFASSVHDIVKRYSSFIDILQDNGLMATRGETPQISAQILTVWVLKKIASTSESRDKTSFADWLYGQEIALLGVTNKQRDWIAEKVRELPKDWIFKMATKLIGI